MVDLRLEEIQRSGFFFPLSFFFLIIMLVDQLAVASASES